MQHQGKNNMELNRELRDKYNNLPLRIHIEVRNDLCRELFWSPSTFYSRIQIRRRVREIEIPGIKKVFEKYGIEIFN